MIGTYVCLWTNEARDGRCRVSNRFAGRGLPSCDAWGWKIGPYGARDEWEGDGVMCVVCSVIRTNIRNQPTNR